MKFFKSHDAFISYAIEDKPIAETIASYLKEKKIKVWYLGHELQVGDSISSVINTGLRNSKCIIPILSPSYLRHWPIVELYTFIIDDRKRKQNRILPVLHNLDIETVNRDHPLLVDLYSILTKDGLDIVCKKLHTAILKNKERERLRKIKIASIISVIAIICITSFSFLSLDISENPSVNSLPLPSKQFLQQAIQDRADELQAKLDNKFQKKIALEKGQVAPFDSITCAYNKFLSTSNKVQNCYEFSSGSTIITGAKNIIDLGIFISDSPYNKYGISSSECYSFGYKPHSPSDTIFYYSFCLLNKDQLTFTIDTFYKSGERLNVYVTNKQYIRSIEGFFTFPVKIGRVLKRKYEIHFNGHKPSEKYVFEMRDGSWKIYGVN
ncbi:MAG: toll/interleukin-1 receptor domain-containing protein [Bacteroidia bacterium]